MSEYTPTKVRIGYVVLDSEGDILRTEASFGAYSAKLYLNEGSARRAAEKHNGRHYSAYITMFTRPATESETHEDNIQFATGREWREQRGWK